MSYTIAVSLELQWIHVVTPVTMPESDTSTMLSYLCLVFSGICCESGDGFIPGQ